MSGPGVGFEFPTIPVSWVKRDLLLFAASIGATDEELHFLYVSGISRPCDCIFNLYEAEP
jgi:hypothetical protein